MYLTHPNYPDRVENPTHEGPAASDLPQREPKVTSSHGYLPVLGQMNLILSLCSFPGHRSMAKANTKLSD